MFFILSALCWRRIRGLRKLPDGRDSLWGRLGLVLMGRAMFSKSLVQFSVDGQGCVPSLLFDLRPGGGGGGGYEVEVEVEVVRIMATSFSRSRARTAALSAPDPAAGHRRPTPPPETPGHSRASLGQSLVGSWLLSPGSWCTQGSVCALPEPVSLVLCKFCNQIPLASKVKFYGGSRSLCQIPRLGNLLWVLEIS